VGHAAAFRVRDGGLLIIQFGQQWTWKHVRHSLVGWSWSCWHKLERSADDLRAVSRYSQRRVREGLAAKLWRRHRLFVEWCWWKYR